MQMRRMAWFSQGVHPELVNIRAVVNICHMNNICHAFMNEHKGPRGSHL